MQIHVLRNRHGSARAACAAWLEGSLWGNPRALGADNIHVYGCWRRRK